MIIKTVVELEQKEIDKIDEVQDILTKMYDELQINLLTDTSDKQNEEIAFIGDTIERLKKIVYLYCRDK